MTTNTIDRPKVGHADAGFQAGVTANPELHTDHPHGAGHVRRGHWAWPRLGPTGEIRLINELFGLAA
jgi:hypothetical protein